MEEKRYDVYAISGRIESLVAENMTIEDAVLLVKAYFNEYYCETDMRMQIRPRANDYAQVSSDE